MKQKSIRIDIDDYNLIAAWAKAGDYTQITMVRRLVREEAARRAEAQKTEKTADD